MISKFGGLNTSVKLFGKCTSFFTGFRLHIIPKPIIHLMCLKVVLFFVSYSLLDLIYMTKLWHFWKFLLEGLMKICTTWCFSFHTIISFPIGQCMTPNLQKCKLNQITMTFKPISKMVTSTNTPPLSQHTFLALQLHMHGCKILCAYLCWQSYILRRKCNHVWKCVGWCKWWFAQVGDTHLPGATPFLHLTGMTQMHQPLHTLALANDFQVWGLEHICEVVWQVHILLHRFSTSYHT